MNNYGKHFNTRQTAQTSPIPGAAQVQNNAGGFVFELDMWGRLERFLILGSEGNTYYVTEQKMTVDNANNLVACLQSDGQKTVKIIREISFSGRAPKNKPALFALAVAAGLGDDATRSLAFSVLPEVARTGSDLLTFVGYMEGFRGWGRAARRGVGNWFTAKSPDQLAYQHMKYAQREGWAMRDLFRLTHPQANSEQQNALFRYIVKGEASEQLPAQLQTALRIRPEMALTKASVQEAASLIVEYRLPREALPTQLLNCPEVWEALLQHMPLTAMIRNLGKMTAVGLIKPLSSPTKLVVERLGSAEALSKARIHPINVLSAMKIYSRGQGFKGSLTWTPDPRVVDALDDAFYASFKNVEPTGKNILIGLDVSGSMSATVGGMDFLTVREAAGAMCMSMVKAEKNTHVMGFCHKFVPLGLSPKMRLDQVLKVIYKSDFGSTDCSLPMTWALENKIQVDAFFVYTDNETFAGRIHPIQALRKYREATGIPAKLVVNGMTSTGFTIADPKDAGSLDVVGFDSAAPSVMADFVRN